VAASDVEGAASFLLFALYFESLVAEREGNSVDAEEYEQLVTEVVPAVLDCLGCIENFDVVKLLASLDSFARIALRHAL